MKNIVVCIDGTSNATEGAPQLPSVSVRKVIAAMWRAWMGTGAPAPAPVRLFPSNVLLFARAIAKRDSTNVSQIVEYIRGVGTDDSAGAVARAIASMQGRGLSQIVQDAYGFLANNCESDDHVYILGFSRGAAAARSLSGLTELFGILPTGLLDRFPDAWHYYNAPVDRRDPILLRVRSPELAAIAEEGNRLRMDHHVECVEGAHRPIGRLAEYPHAPRFRSHEERGPRGGASLRGDVPDTKYVPLPLHFVGVWDTVFAADREGFHEDRLAWNVGTAYQALAIHEVRDDFQPVLWRQSCSHQKVIQTWFTGAHSDIGGGNGNTALSSVTLDWMIHRSRGSHAVHGGTQLEFNQAFLDAILRPNFSAEITYPQESALWRGRKLKARDIGSTAHTGPGRPTGSPPIEFRHNTIDLRAVHGRPAYHQDWQDMLEDADERSETMVPPE